MIEPLLESPYWIVDILPKQVPAHAPGQYFAVERHYLSEPQRSAIRQKQLNVLWKLNCYMDIAVDEEQKNPAPELLARWIRERRLNVLVGGGLIVTDPDDTYMTVYNPDEELLQLLRTLSAAEGLFVWRPADQTICEEEN